MILIMFLILSLRSLEATMQHACTDNDNMKTLLHLREHDSMYDLHDGITAEDYR